MRILLSSYFPLGIGGAEVSMLSLAKGLKKKGHTVIIASTQQYPGFKTYIYSKVRLFPFFLKDFYFKQFISKIIVKEKIDIVHTNDYLSAVGAIRAAKSFKIRSVTHYRDYWFACPKGSCLMPNGKECNLCNFNNLIHCSKWYRIPWDFYKMIHFRKIIKQLNFADIKIAISKSVAEKLRSSGIKNKIHVLPNSISIEDFAKAKISSSQYKHLILYVGSLNYHKGFKVLLDAVVPILNKDTGLLIIGHGPLSKIIPASPNITHLKKVKYNEIPNLYAASDMVVFPSIWQEPFGRVVIEAMAAGKPVIASAVGGVVDIIKHKENGILVKAGDVSGLRESILDLIKNKKLREDIGLSALKSSKNYSNEKIVAKLEQIYS